MAAWAFLTNHARVLSCIAADPTVRLRDIADRVGITERAAHRIVSELCDAGYLTRERRGTRNVYAVNTELPLRGAPDAKRSVSALLRVLAGDRPDEAATAA